MLVRGKLKLRLEDVYFDQNHGSGTELILGT